jgi:hypothetical protein
VRTRSFLFCTAIIGLVGGTNACSSGAGGSSFDDGDSKDGKDDKASDPNGDVFDDDSVSPLNTSGCADQAKFVYVLSREMGLYKFNPGDLTFTDIGVLRCKDSSSPNSMAVDRSGTAWVNYASGNLFKVSTSDASCQATNFDPSQADTKKFGMAFASNSAGSKEETLYMVGIDDSGDTYRGTGLSKLDLSTLELTRIGDFSDGLRSFGAELTGTGDARLFGFVTASSNSPTRLAQVKKDSGATPSCDQATLAQVKTGSAFAFSFWGGDFWFYTAQKDRSSSVTRYQTSGDKSLTVVKPDVGFAIVGAGVSTCAPVTPPK